MDDNTTLSFAKASGMQFKFVSREDFRNKASNEFINNLIEEIDISDYVGQEVTFEFELKSDDFVNEDGFEYQFDIPEDIEKEFIKIPPMIIQPFVENAIIHGMSHLETRKGLIKIAFKDLGNVLECQIEDNGVGRNKSSEIKETSNSLHKSTALEVTRERLQFLSSEKSSIEIIDLEDKLGNSLGTKVILRLAIFNPEDS